MTARRSWKRTESRIAELVGGERQPVNGRGDQPDVAADRLAVEVKHRGTIPAWLKQAVAQARAGAGPHRCPIAVIHEAGARYVESIVVMRLDDYLDWYGEPPPAR